MARYANPDDNKTIKEYPIRNKALDLAIQKRDRFLEKNPHLIPYQEEIDRILDGAGSADNRMAALGIMIEAKLGELREQLMQLSELLPSETAKTH